jgi:hypothetical protein
MMQINEGRLPVQTGRRLNAIGPAHTQRPPGHGASSHSGPLD